MARATHPTFWDVDTQVDFIMPDGKLYIPGAEEVLPNLKKLTDYAHEKGIQILGSVDYHSPDDPEMSDHPDFKETFPPHCLAGTPGQEKVPETRPLNPLWIPNEPMDPEELRKQVLEHEGEIIFRKQWFDVFTNPNVPTVLETLRPEHLVVYGVALDVCDAYAIEGFLKRGDVKVSLVLDATKAIDPKRGEQLVEEWRRRGVQIVSTEEVLSGKLEG
ncbi:MAG: isochorismatase [Candidatus Poribacteria bacterium]|nr:MAG: isochorismatase [Candidatus Poribacteria bacterium]